MRRSVFLLAAAGLCLSALWLYAEESCDTSALDASFRSQLELLETQTIGALVEIIALAQGGLLACSDTSYTFDQGEGAQPVLGPLAAGEGLYILTMTTEGGARIEGKALEGCGKDLDGTIHNFSVGQGIRGASNLVEVESDCTFYLEVSKITAPWTLTISRAS